MFLDEDLIKTIQQGLPEQVESTDLLHIFPGTTESLFLAYICSGELEAVYKHKTWYVTREGLTRFIQKHSTLNEE